MPTRAILAGAALGLAVAAAATPARVLAYSAVSSTAPAGVSSVVPAGAPSAVPAGAPSAAPLQAFVLAGAPDSLADLQAHAQDIGVVYPTLYECSPVTGAIVAEGTGAQAGAQTGTEVMAQAGAITMFARAKGMAVMPRFDCQNGPTVHTILTEPHARARTIAGLVHVAASAQYAGVNLDLENDVPSDRNALTSFASALARDLHASARKLSIDVDGVTHDDPAISTGLYNDRALARIADYVFVIAWGTHWAGSAPGPIAPLSHVLAIARYLASLPDAGRFVLGAPMYGLDWPIAASSDVPGRRPPRAGALQDAGVLALASATGATPTRDRTVDEMTFAYTRAGVAHRVWYMDAKAIADRLRIARAYGLQAGVWRLGEEDQALWSSPFV
jgi:spore germination protein YaaH